MHETIIYERDRWVAKITLNRPEKRNAINEQMIKELYETFDEVDADPEIRVLIVTGAGERAFSAGWDMFEPVEAGKTKEDFLRQEPIKFRQGLVRQRNLFLRMWDLRQPVISAVNGYAIAAGCNLALVPDITLASENAVFGEPEIRQYSLSPVLMIPWLTGYKKAHEIMLTGDLFDAQEALRMGIVNRVVPLAELQETANRLAWRIAKVGAFNVQTQKRAMKRMYEMMGFKEALDYHTVGKNLIYTSNIEEQEHLRDLQYNEGIKAFLKERDDMFKEPWKIVP